VRTFKDKAGRAWTVSLDIDAVRRVRSALKVNLISADFAQVLQDLLSDPVLLCDVIFVICKPEADRQNVADVDFGRAMAGDAIEQATTALLEELADFTPNRRDREKLQTVIKGLLQYAEKMRDRAERKVDEALKKLLDGGPEKTSGPSSGSSPASLESTPAV
jgi:hypothetical protein